MSRTILVARKAGAGAGLPVNTVPPSISGTVAHGNVLTATPGTWTGSPSLSYQWYAGASPISGETGTTYTCDRADVSIGPAITCRETDSVGATFADSNALAYYPAQDFEHTYDLAEDVTVVSGAVDSILNQGAGGGSIAAAGSTNRPAYAATDAAFANEPTATFDGGDDYLVNAAADFGGTLTQFLTMLAGLIGASPSSNDRIVDYAGSLRLITTSGGLPSFISTGGGGATSTGTTDCRGDAECFGALWDSGVNQSVYVAGTAEDTDANTSVSRADAAALAVGASSAGGNTTPMTMAIVVATRTTSTRKVLDFNAYCSWRFGT